VGPSPLAHLLQHVQADGSPTDADLPGGQDRVDPTATADVEDGLPGLQIGMTHRAGDTQGPRDGTRRQLA
jgi:hypothetical protein